MGPSLADLLPDARDRTTLEDAMQMSRTAAGSTVLATAALVLAWGSTFAAIKIGLRDSPPMLFAGMRSVLGGAVMAWLAARRGRSGLGLDLSGNWSVYAVLTLLNVIGFFGLQTLAIQHLASGLAAVLIYLQPVLTAVLAPALLHEHVGLRSVIGLALAFCGIIAVSLDAMHGHVSTGGVLLALSAALSWSLGTIGFKRYAGRVDPWWAVAVPFLAGGVLLTAGGAAVEGVSVQWTGSFVGSFLYASLVGTALAWALWFSLVTRGDTARTASTIFFVPVVAVIAGVVVLGESPKPSLLVGGALVVIGVYVANRRPSAPAT